MVSQRVSSSNSTGNDMEHLSKSDVDSCNKKEFSRSEESHEQVRKKVRSNDSVFIDMSEFKDRDTPIFVEACAGSATLSFSIQRRGFEVYPIDHVRNHHRTQCRVLQLDLTLISTWELLRRITDDYFCAGFHFGVPCGTCSRARGIPLADGSDGPPPLRDQEHVLGLPNLSEANRRKVETANILYERCCEFILFLDERGIPWTVENPTNSWLWDLPCFGPIIARGEFVNFDACAHGSTRKKKKTSFLVSRSEFSVLEKWCDGSHEHEAWGVDPETGVFNTSKEAEYPRPLCEAYADVLEMVTAARGQHPRALSDDKSKVRAMAQPRGRKFPQLISEYKRCVSVKSASEPSLDGKKCLNSTFCNVPAGSKLLRTEARGDSKLYVFGVFRSMEEFVLDSRQLWHPYDELVNLPDALIKCIFLNLTLSPHELTKWRIDTLRRWSKMAMDLKKDESELKSKLHPKVKKCLGAKRLLLLEALAKQVGWEDENIHSDLRSGFKLTGYCPPTGIFERECKPAVLDKSSLMRQALFIRPMILGKMGRHPITDDDKELYDITMREASEKKGWLEGPYGVDYV